MDNGFSTMRLDGRRAIVTGGASGIGRATAIAMADLGAEVVVTDIDEAGGAAVAEQIGGSFAMLDVSDPTAWARVVATAGPFDIAFLNAGIDELLRFDGPVQHTVRVAMHPTSFADADGGKVVVEPGHTILTVLGAANRDPAMFDDPHTLRLDRPNAGRHTAFAAGIHYCLGASLAKRRRPSRSLV